MYVVFWLEQAANKNAESSAISGKPGPGCPHAHGFESDQMKDALEFMESLRRRQRNGEPIGFVTMCSENPDVVGLAGVADPSPDYDWKKRRR